MVEEKKMHNSNIYETDIQKKYKKLKFKYLIKKEKSLNKKNIFYNTCDKIFEKIEKSFWLEDNAPQLIAEKFGALKFKDVVLKVEKLKFKLIKKINPNFIKSYEKRLDKKKNIELKNITDPEEKKQIIEKYKYYKRIARKEFYTEQNRNYHFDVKNAAATIEYLKWNKEVHKSGLKKNVIFLPIWATLTMFLPFTSIFLILEILSTIINFECVNIQNHHINRMELDYTKLKKIEKRSIDRSYQKYGKAQTEIAKLYKEADDMPSLEELIEHILSSGDKELIEQLRSLFINNNQNMKNKIKEKEMN